MTQPNQRTAQAFDALAGDYDDAYHDRIARALVAFVAPAPAESVADVACGTGAVALAVAAVRAAHPGGAPVLALDLSPGMVAAGRARAARLAPAGAIDWRVAPALPLPVADAGLDVVLCASSLHFLGRPALADWLRVLRPGGRVGFTLPLTVGFHPGGAFAELLATDLALPDTAADAAALAQASGFTAAAARTVTVGARTVALVRARKPTQPPAQPQPPAAGAVTRS
ncbi:class I SAM-dependent methyltransferase [Streptacidiphilus sp. P02-A3a]|uniref:class I SAM-dependent methyltransferase n=1 Tax=Streptacidiphilus sp. P02-A3a TaxID=2704468 RepID=UPI0015FAC24D|nr:methyltransferase domain-containing protein [Streptacidiphilus sp. P02-A3a]QMU73167.1 methyltransferase domain-containing protein [Streptacidiphilus sp. P02-A3a]